MDDPSTGQDRQHHSDPAPAATSSPDGPDETAVSPRDELSDAALDAVVGGVSLEAALARAAAYSAGRLS